MYRKEVNERSPLRLLEKSIHGGLGPGNLGVVLARAGVGKTAFLVQLGLDDLLRDRKVLHISLSASIEEVRQWYDELFADLQRHTRLEDPTNARLLIERNRMIQVYGGLSFSPAKLRSVMDLLREHADYVPAAILVDGLDWAKLDPVEIEEFKDIALAANAELWMTALTHRHARSGDGDQLPPPCDRFDTHVDVAVHLTPRGARVDLRLLRDHDAHELKATTLELEPVTMRLTDTATMDVVSGLSRRATDCILHSGGAPGAEAVFSEVAVKYGFSERNYSFEGHGVDRSSGVVVLPDSELRRGDVSLAYVSKRMGRQYSSAPHFRKILQTIWHQVNSAQQVLVVGLLLEDGTVRGGTGWGAELARVWNKPLWVFDQEKQSWFHWSVSQQSWEPSETPRLIANNVCGTGTRSLSDAGRAAIESVFEQTFSRD